MRLLLNIVFLCLSFVSGNICAKQVTVAVLAFSGVDYAKKSWQPTIDYLQTQIPQDSFKLIAIEPSNVSKLEYLVEKNQIDFVITQPITYIDLKLLYGAVGLLTLVDKSKYAQFGSVIFTQHTDKNLNLSYLKNRTLAGASPKGLGGWLIAYNTFLQAGIDPYTQAKKVVFLGVQDNIVNAVLAKQVDIGIVRTGVLERMIASGAINSAQFSVINQRYHDNFPYLLSSELYPEWVFAKTKKVANKMAKKVASALLSMPANSHQARARGYWEWITVIDYQPIHDLMKKLKIGVYKHYGNISLLGYIKQNIALVSIFILFLLILIMMSITIIRLNYSLRRAKNSIQSKYDLVLNSVYDSIYGVDLAGKCIFINQSMSNSTGWKAEEIIGKQQHDILHHSHKDGRRYPINECPVYHTINDGISRFIEQDTFWRKDGSNFSVEYNCTPIKDDANNVIGGVVVFRDIDEKIKTTQKLHQYQHDLFHIARINTMGEMVSSIAHEVNQPLTVITTNAFIATELLKSRQFSAKKNI